MFGLPVFCGDRVVIAELVLLRARRLALLAVDAQCGVVEQSLAHVRISRPLRDRTSALPVFTVAVNGQQRCVQPFFGGTAASCSPPADYTDSEHGLAGGKGGTCGCDEVAVWSLVEDTGSRPTNGPGSDVRTEP